MSPETFAWRYTDEAPFAVRGRALAYRGPRFDGIVAGVTADGTLARAAGPGVGDATLAWGADGGDLSGGVGARLDGLDLRLHRRRYGLARATRAIDVAGDAAGPLVLRLRRWKRVTLEDADGHALVSYGSKGRLHPRGEARHVALLLLAKVAGLDRLLEARIEQLGFFPSP